MGIFDKFFNKRSNQTNWPDGDDGDVFRLLKKNGFNFRKEVKIDFNIDFDHWPLTNEEKKEIIDLYPDCEFYDPDDEDIEEGNLIGYAKFQIKEILTYELVIKTQEVVSNQMKQYGGWCESWGVMKE